MSLGRWKVNVSDQLIVDVQASHRYRVTNEDAKGNRSGVEIIVDGVPRSSRLMVGESIDIEGRRISINQPEGTTSSGWYVNLD
jgi:hypothetical protein